MKIKKVLNNNAVTVVNDDNEELVVMGLGLAFQKKKGDELEEEKIERVFTLENKEVSRKLKNLISEIPLEYVEVSEDIINYAKEKLQKTLDENIYLTLTDHISFSLTRYKQGLMIKNPMIWDIKNFYKQEYIVGIKALQIIREKLHVELPEDEAASIALHIVNAELSEDMPNVVNMIKFIHDILNIIRYYFKIDFDEDSLIYNRLVTHLKFFAQRVLNGSPAAGEDEDLYNIVKGKYVEAYKCSEKIKEYIKNAFDFIITNEEMTYLIVHIERLVNKDLNKKLKNQ